MFSGFEMVVRLGDLRQRVDGVDKRADLVLVDQIEHLRKIIRASKVRPRIDIARNRGPGLRS